MKGLIGLSFLFIVLVVLGFQNCSLDSSGGISNLPSVAGTGSDLLSVSADMNPLPIATGATSLTVTGTCDQGPYTTYAFELSFKESGQSNSTVYRPSGINCVNKRYSITTTLSSLGIGSGKSGSLTIKIIGSSSSGEQSSPDTIIAVTSGSGGGNATCGTMANDVGCNCGGSPTYIQSNESSAGNCKTKCQTTAGAKCCEFHAPSGDCYVSTNTSSCNTVAASDWISATCN